MREGDVVASLADEDHQARTKAVTDEGRAFLQEQFAALGLDYVPGYANFVLVNVGRGRAVFDALLRQGIIVRAMDGYGLPAWVRISVGTPDQNQRCIAALTRVLPVIPLQRN